VSAEKKLEGVDEKNLPEHIAIIMDGNGRWAKRRGLPRIKGHEAGIESVRQICRACARLKIKQLTLYAFSVDNWKRPRAEVEYLMNLLSRYLKNERKEIMENNIRLRVIGRMDGLPKAARDELNKTIEESSKNDGMTLCLALNYGGRTEIVDAVRKIAGEVAAGRVKAEDIDENLLANYLYTAGMKDPDLLIRTAGEKRVSNFLLWQISYTEFWFTDVCWPDFREEHLMEALREYAGRVRKFGGLRE